MKKLLLLLIVPFFSFGQSYSNFYGNHDVNIKSDVNINSNINIEKNVNVSGNIKKTIKTIDYGALAQANAIKEKNQIEMLQISNQREKDAMLAIANDPYQAFNYGQRAGYNVIKSFVKPRGFKKVYFEVNVPHPYFFVPTNPIPQGNGVSWTYQNISVDNITTELNFGSYINIPKASQNIINMTPEIGWINQMGLEKYAKCEGCKLGLNKETGVFYHKIEVSRCKVYGFDGFKQTQIREDDYMKYISDTYMALVDGVYLVTHATYKADKNEVTFEELEGRRYYLRRLVDQTMATLQLQIKK